MVEHLGVERVLAGQGVGAHDPHVGQAGRRRARQRDHGRVDVDGHHRRPRGGHQGGHRAGTRADLQHHVVRAHAGRLHDQVVDVQVDQEVLPEPVLRRHPALGEQGTEIRLRLS